MKKYYFISIVFSLISYFLFAPSAALEASKSGINLWFEQILPTLLPFTVLSCWVIRSDICSVFRSSNAKKQPLILPEELFILLFGFLFGFPIGSKLSSDFYQAGKISKEHAQTLAMFTNHMSPAFVLGYVCTQQLQNVNAAVLLFAYLYVPSLLFAVFFLLIKQPKMSTLCENSLTIVGSDEHKNTASSFQIDMKIIDAGIISGFVTLIKLCGYMVFFSIGVSMIQHISILPDAVKIIAVLCFEVTNAVSYLCTHISNEALKLWLTSISLSFGGLSGLAQTASMICPAGLSIKKYILTKVLLTCLSGALMLLYLLIFQQTFR